MTSLEVARARIADCLQLDEQGRLVQRRDYLNLAGLDLTGEELIAVFVPRERGLPEISLADLPHLRYLDLTGNQLAELPECVIGFTDLVWLGLNFNRIEKLPEEIGALVSLQRLYLRGNGLKELPAGVGSLQALVELDLTGCEINALPVSMGRLDALDHVGLEESALASDLRAAWKEKGWQSLREHLRRLGEGARAGHRPVQFVGKVVLVGSQENGKTCLQRALRGEEFIAGHKTTEGMSRERLHLGLHGELVSLAERARIPGPREDVIDLTLWDMGGQESYQHTHQMFFTPSAVYLLVTLPRQGGSVQELDHWIELVKRRTDGKATIIVVSTWCKEYPADRALTLSGLQSRHGEAIRALVSVDSKEGTGIPELRSLLAHEVQTPRAGCRHTWLPGWAKVLDELASAQEAFLRWPRIPEICVRHGIEDRAEQRQVIRTGHLTGSLLWREDIPAGEDVVILNPDWLSRAVSRLLDDEVTQQAHGLVEVAKLERVWEGPAIDGTPGYTRDTYEALTELMEINELAYRPRVPGKMLGEGPLLLITQLVESKPAHDIEKEWEAIAPRDFEEAVRVIAFRKVGDIRYEDVPDIIYLLIFRLRELSLGRTDHTKSIHWQRGLLVKDDYGNAGRIELEGGRLRITVRYRLDQGLMHSIIHRIGVRDDGYWNGRGLEKVEFVPCGRLCVKGTPDAGLISRETCEKSLSLGDKNAECQTCREFLPIEQLLTQAAKEPALQIEMLRHIRSWFDELLVQGVAIRKDIAANGQATRTDIAALGPEMKTSFENLGVLVRSHGDAILDAFTSEWSEGPRLFSLIPVPGRAWNPKQWTQLTFRVTVWCEAIRWPVPVLVLGNDQGEGRERGREIPGSVLITLTREWVGLARNLLNLSKFATLAMATGGVGGIQAIVTGAGGVVAHDRAGELASELANQSRMMKEIVDAIPNDRRSLLRDREDESLAPGAADGAEEREAFGSLVEGDLRLMRFLRDEFKKQDPNWGGLKPRNDATFQRIWVYPQIRVASDS